MPPPRAPPALLPERVLFVTSTVPPWLKMAAPSTDAGSPRVKRTPTLSEKVLFATLTLLGAKPLLPEKLLSVKFTVPPSLWMPPPLGMGFKLGLKKLLKLLLEKVLLVAFN